MRSAISQVIVDILQYKIAMNLRFMHLLLILCTSGSSLVGCVKGTNQIHKRGGGGRALSSLITISTSNQLHLGAHGLKHLFLR